MGSFMEKMQTAAICQTDEVPLLDYDDDTGANQIELSESIQYVKIKDKKPIPWFVFTLSLLSAIGGFLFGYDTGVVSGAQLPLTTQFHLTKISREIFVSITIGAAAVFAIVGGVLNDKIGRKPTTLLASLVFTIGALMLALAQDVATLYVGRFVLGIGIGLASMTVPVYIAEASPPHLRGILVSLNQAFIAGGQVVANLVSGAFCTTPQGWRWMLGLAATPAIIQMIGFIFMPESPRWLVSRGKYNQAKKVLRRMRCTLDVKDEFDAIKNACDEEARANEALGGQSVVRKALTTPAVRRALIIGCALQAFAQLSGINTIMYYSASIIKMSGVTDACQAIWLAAATSCSNFLFTFLGIALVERLGRRKVLLSSITGVLISLILIAIAFEVENAHAPAVEFMRPQQHDACAVIGNCHQCSFEVDCGYCFIESTEGQVSNSTCLPINSAAEAYSSIGSCSENSTARGFTYATDYCPTAYSWAAVVAMVVYLACFAPGFAPLPWTINSEIYPLWARSFGNSIASFFNWSCNLTISLTFLSLADAIGKPGAFYMYAAITFIGLIFFVLVLPETRGKSLEEMESQFSGSWFIFRKKKHQSASH